MGSYCVKLHVIELIELSFRKGDFGNEASGEINKSRNSDKIHSSLAAGICEIKGLQLVK